MITKIILQRHAQSIGNRDGIYLGHSDLGLTEQGREQAEITAKHLEKTKIDAVYSSDLKRAYETALPHARIRGLDVIKSASLREIYVGDWEAKQVSYLKKEFYEEFVINRTHRNFVYPSGESTFDAAQRIRTEIEKIAEKNSGKTVLIVCHSAAIRAFWYYLCNYTELNMTDKVPFMKNCAYCILEYTDSKLIPIKYGIENHLPATNVLPV